MRWFTSDTHFRHRNIIDYDGRPYSNLEEMEEALIANWNVCVGKNDIVYHLGDFAFMGASKWHEIADDLNGRIVIVRGNHDLGNRATLSNIGLYNTKIIDVADIVSIEVGQRKVIMSHYPYALPGMDNRNRELWPANNGLWLLHGHIHKHGHGLVDVPRVNKEMKMINVGCMNWDYFPVSEAQILDTIRKSEDI